MDSASDNSHKKEAHVHASSTVHGCDVDVGAQLIAETDSSLTPQEASRLRAKIDWHVIPLMCSKITFMDKTTLGEAAVLGIMDGAHLTANQYNWLGTIFYLSYLVFQYPQNLALQRFPVGKWMSINIFLWAVVLLCHAACKSFGSLFAVRFLLGMCEGAITPGFMIVTSMFYTHAEQTRRVGYWFLMNGFAVIILGFISFGLLHTHTAFMPWQWLMIITGTITLITSVLFWFFFPDSPTTAWFLTPEERVAAIRRIQVNQSGVENKRFKKEQFLETVKDPKTWLMAFFAGSANIVNSLTNQRQLIISQFGFNGIQTTLLGCVDGAVEILTIWLGVTVLVSQPSIGRSYAGVLMYIPGILGSILVSTLPFSNKIGLLFSYWISIFAIAPFPIFLGWVSSITSGHTKRITTNGIVLCSYAVGNAVSQFMWKVQYQPRNHIPWAVITSCNFAAGIALVVLRFMFASENRKREQETPDRHDAVYILDESGAERKVDKAFLDLTDKQNRDFRYVL
ncbi:major facilitator superfamily domain-containing protein [Suillus discolor]|uniref:Major facilitator superfamily domain-containing protein n=1 Tax=Suillus discolor TaxID=1912936 RepID=A0A9P7FHB6_9AGAM|nr:major facilitator superfamily domain-containing protein [Suillus discolor]KAG2116583.1 major facilitator superfamily domain-containing protein [Suillus discolor]